MLPAESDSPASPWRRKQRQMCELNIKEAFLQGIAAKTGRKSPDQAEYAGFQEIFLVILLRTC
jgi:hypothetical protein